MKPSLDRVRELGRDGLMLGLAALASLSALAWLMGVGR